MTTEQRENYQDYIIRNIIRKFDGRRHSEIIEFLDYAKEVVSELSFISSQSREIEPNFTIKQ
ncbi:hypothetical protein [Flavobacterium yafengii]|uniref:hypothetical protein n=1 Tax=Flavobacterium yafengii TaxID=3041253 RepID=UPI0024A7BD30|nr:hypothetical protein [Flavobacterium yafengii]MDI6048045.1 hypothetical protein [Flavobacterium yafengii]